MLEMLKNWEGEVEINGVRYSSVKDISSGILTAGKPFTILLLANSNKAVNEANNNADSTVKSGEIKITVKKYMTQKSNPGFDFMAKFNNDEPMPFRTMIGKVVKETKGMVKMELHADIYAEKICTCMKCGRVLSNPVSQFFGVGPECGGHNYTHPFETDDQLKEAVAEYRKQLQNITWTGWVIKSAITEQEEV